MTTWWTSVSNIHMFSVKGKCIDGESNAMNANLISHCVVAGVEVEGRGCGGLDTHTKFLRRLVFLAANLPNIPEIIWKVIS